MFTSKDRMAADGHAGNSQVRAWRLSLAAALWLMVPFDLLASLGMDIYLPAVPEMPQALATTPAVVQLTLSLYMLVLGFGQLVFGPLSDRVGRRPVLLCGALLFTLSSAGLAATASAPIFVMLRVLQAAGGAAALVATFATIRDVYGARDDVVGIYALFGGILAFVPAVGPILGAVIDHLTGWRGIFLTLAALCALAGSHAMLRWPETRPDGSVGLRWSDLATILRHGPFWIHSFGSATAYGAFFVYFSTASQILIARHGLSPAAFSLVFGTVALVMIVTASFTARLAAHHGERSCLQWGVMLIMAGAGLLALSEMLAAASIPAFIAPVWAIAVGISLTVAVTTNGALRPFDRMAGTATAVNSCLQSLIVTGLGTLAVLVLPVETAWPLVGFCIVAGLIALGLACRLPAT